MSSPFATQRESIKLWGCSPCLDVRSLSCQDVLRSAASSRVFSVLQVAPGDCRHSALLLCSQQRKSPALCSLVYEELIALLASCSTTEPHAGAARVPGEARALAQRPSGGLAFAPRHAFSQRSCCSSLTRQPALVTTFLELHGNSLLRRDTATYLASRGRLLERLVRGQVSTRTTPGSEELQRRAHCIVLSTLC